MKENEAKIEADKQRQVYVGKKYQHKSGRQYEIIDIKHRPNLGKWEVQISARPLDANPAKTTLTDEINYFLSTFSAL